MLACCIYPWQRAVGKTTRRKFRRISFVIFCICLVEAVIWASATASSVGGGDTGDAQVIFGQKVSRFQATFGAGAPVGDGSSPEREKASAANNICFEAAHASWHACSTNRTQTGGALSNPRRDPSSVTSASSRVVRLGSSCSAPPRVSGPQKNSRRHREVTLSMSTMAWLRLLIMAVDHLSQVQEPVYTRWRKSSFERWSCFRRAASRPGAPAAGRQGGVTLLLSLVVGSSFLGSAAASPSENSGGVLSAGGAVLASTLVWPAVVAVPLFLSPAAAYTRLFPASAYNCTSRPLLPASWPLSTSLQSLRPALGLGLGISAVAVGQIVVSLYHWLRCKGSLGSCRAVQAAGAPQYSFQEGLLQHFSNPEGFALLGSYLSLTWLCDLMPPTYYSFEGGIAWRHVASCLLLQDMLQYMAHMAEHKISSAFYRHSHKPHHSFTNPKLFDAFDGSAADTVIMILLPLYTTAWLVPACNVWDYMTFGSLYAAWLTLIHSEWAHPWDPLFRQLGWGTAADHHVHHKLFLYNFGHIFMYWDFLCGTYKSPEKVRVFNKDV